MMTEYVKEHLIEYLAGIFIIWFIVHGYTHIITNDMFIVNNYFQILSTILFMIWAPSIFISMFYWLFG